MCSVMLGSIRQNIGQEYSHYLSIFSDETYCDLIPSLVAYSLFEWPVYRNDTLGTSDIKIEVGKLEFGTAHASYIQLIDLALILCLQDLEKWA